MKIIGNGFLACGLKKVKLSKNSKNLIFYAAGVSNSNSKINKDFISLIFCPKIYLYLVKG